MSSEIMSSPQGVAHSYTPEEEQLLLSASSGSIDRVKRYLSAETKGAVDLEGRSALHLAANNGHLEVVETLVHFGCSVRLTDNFGQTALQRAASQGHLNIVKYLLRKHSLVDHQDDVHGNTALHEASWRGFSQTVEVLCKGKANAYIRNKAGFAPLHLCCQNGHNQTCRVLLTYGCKPNVKNNYGDTPLHTSCRYGHAGVVRILISAHSSVCDQNKNGDTALHIAAAMGRRKLTRILLESRCDVTIKNKQNETALDITRRKMFLEVESMIMNPPEPVLPSEIENRGRSRHKKDKRCREGGTSSRGSNKQRRKKKALSDDSKVSPYGCHYFPDTECFPAPKLDSLPSEPLKRGEQYYLDLAGNIKKGPIGYGLGCQCGPMFHKMEETMKTDKKDVLGRLEVSNEEIDRKLVALEKKTRHQLQQLHQTIKERLAAERLECMEKTEKMCRKERLKFHEESVRQVEGLRQELHTWLQYRLDKMESHCSDSSSDSESVHSDDSALPQQRSRSVGTKKRPSVPSSKPIVRSKSEEKVTGSASSEDLTQMLCSITHDLAKEDISTYKGLRVLDYPSQSKGSGDSDVLGNKSSSSIELSYPKQGICEPYSPKYLPLGDTSVGSSHYSPPVMQTREFSSDTDSTSQARSQIEGQTQVEIHPVPNRTPSPSKTLSALDEDSNGGSTPIIPLVSDSDYSPASSKKSTLKSVELSPIHSPFIKPVPVKCPEVPKGVDVCSNGPKVFGPPQVSKSPCSQDTSPSFLHHKYEMRPPELEQPTPEETSHIAVPHNEGSTIPIPPPMPNTRYPSVSRMRGYNEDKHYRFRTFFPSTLGIPTVPPGSPAFAPINSTVIQYNGSVYHETRAMERFITDHGEENGSEHNDSGYSTKFCGSHKGSSPALSAVTDETDCSEAHWTPAARSTFYRWDSYRSDKSAAMIHGRSSLV